MGNGLQPESMYIYTFHLPTDIVTMLNNTTYTYLYTVVIPPGCWSKCPETSCDQHMISG